MPEPPRIAHLDEFDQLPGPDTLTWLPVRHTLGIRAFGCNAYRAAEAGHDVVEPHTEKPSEHEELYFVASGRATFTIDGVTHDAPPAPTCSSRIRPRTATRSQPSRERPCSASAARRCSRPRPGSGCSARAPRARSAIRRRRGRS